MINDHLLAQKNNQIQKADSLEKAVQRSTNRYYFNAVNFALKNNSKEVAPYIALTDIATINHKYLDTIYSNLTPDVAKSKYGVILKNYLDLVKE